MRSQAPALLPIFRSQTQAEILALVLLHPDQEFSLTDLSRRLWAPLTSIHREVDRLAEASLVGERAVGRNWAARHAGQTGAAPQDIDVLVIGDGVSRGDVYEAADRAQARLGLPVNPTIRTATQWTDPGDALSSQIRSSPKLTVVGDDSADGTISARCGRDRTATRSRAPSDGHRRCRRNELEYPSAGTAPSDVDEASEAVAASRSIVQASRERQWL